MGFFSNLFKAISQPVVNVVSQANTTLHNVTGAVDNFNHAVGNVVHSVPVIGPIADEFVFQANLATDVANNLGDLGNTTAALGQMVGNALLVGDCALAHTLSTVEHAQIDSSIHLVGDAIHTSIHSLFDFG